MHPYGVTLIQNKCHVVRHLGERDEKIRLNLSRIDELIGFQVHRIGDIKLAVTGEYSLFGQFRPRSLEDWIEMALPMPNFATDMMAEMAHRHQIYLVGHFLERHSEFPGRYFNTTVLMDPGGKIVLEYRKHNGPNNLNTTYTGPGDVYDRFVEVFGEDALFPVADTPIGRLGIMVCGDMQYPEVARCLALKGAEVIIHPTAEVYRVGQNGWEATRIARAFENKVYMLSCTTGAFLGTERPEEGYRGRSQVITPDGEIMAMSDGGEAVVPGVIDIDRLRLRKTGTAGSGHAYNPTVLIRADLYSREYRRAKTWPTNAFLAEPIRSPSQAKDIARGLIEQQVAMDILKKPEA